MPAAVTLPVQVLREHTTTLEAALSVCLAEPTHKPVHRLRTETRRVGAQLLLLGQLPEVPEHRDEAAVLLKELKKLRRAAGEVRDLDVQRKLLDEYAEAEAGGGSGTSSDGAEAAAQGSRGAAKKGAGKKAKAPESDGSGRASTEDEPVKQAREKGASELRAHMGKQRDDAAADLQRLLKKRQTKAAAAAEALLKVLHPAQDVQISAEELLRHAQGVFERDGLLADSAAAELSDDELHSLRKTAKAARYLTETLPDNASTTKAAARFEALQQAGGEWHDLLDLARAARHHLGKTHELSVELAAERDRKLEVYREALKGVAGGPMAAKRPATRLRKRAAKPVSA